MSSPSLILRFAASVVVNFAMICAACCPCDLSCVSFTHLVERMELGGSQESCSIFLHSARAPGECLVGTYSTSTEMALSFTTAAPLNFSTKVSLLSCIHLADLLDSMLNIMPPFANFLAPMNNLLLSLSFVPIFVTARLALKTSSSSVSCSKGFALIVSSLSMSICHDLMLVLATTLWWVKGILFFSAAAYVGAVPCR